MEVWSVLLVPRSFSSQFLIFGSMDWASSHLFGGQCCSDKSSMLLNMLRRGFDMLGNTTHPKAREYMRNHMLHSLPAELQCAASVLSPMWNSKKGQQKDGKTAMTARDLSFNELTSSHRRKWALETAIEEKTPFWPSSHFIWSPRPTMPSKHKAFHSRPTPIGYRPWIHHSLGKKSANCFVPFRSCSPLYWWVCAHHSWARLRMTALR